MQTFKGSCHCGNVKYEVQTDLKMAMECNCSMCRRKGTLFTFVASEHFNLISGENSLTDYQFNKKNIHHTFCKTCGVTSFASGKDPSGKEMKAINVRCLDDVDLKTLNIVQVNGKSF